MKNPFKKKTKLKFVTNEDKKSKNKKFIIIGFIILVLLIGTVSLMYFLKSYNYDFKKAFGIEVTEEQEKILNVKLEGKSTILVACTSRNEDELYFASLIRTDLDKQRISVACLPTDDIASSGSSNISLKQAFASGGAHTLVSNVKSDYDVDIDRYIVINEKNFKSFMSKFGNYQVNVKKGVNYASEDFAFSLYEGKQMLTGDKLLKYIRYQKIKGDNNYLHAQSNIISDVVEQVLNLKNFNENVDKYDEVVNYVDTNISVVDFTKSKNEIIALIASPDKEDTVSVNVESLRK